MGLFMILQRYTFGSKSQPTNWNCRTFESCLWYCKDIHLEANHNIEARNAEQGVVVYDIAKIYIWKQITTSSGKTYTLMQLFMILQRYTFGSKSQLCPSYPFNAKGCLWYCKDIHLEANHNKKGLNAEYDPVVYDIAKIYIWKQITTS